MALINKIRVLFSEVVAALGYTPENPANKGVANGYAPLNASAVLNSTFGGTGVNNSGKLLNITANASISGTNTGDQLITLTGDVTGSGTGSFAATLANTTVTAGTYGSATQVARFTVNSKGQLTLATNVSVNDPTKLPLAGGTMTGNISFAGSQPWPTFNQNTTGNAATATALQTARTINGVSFNGTADITLTANTTQALTISGPLTGGSFNGGTATTLGIQTANGTLAGALSSADWTTFNGKQAAITLTTTGSSGAATFASNTLNIPNYTLTGLGGQPALNGTGFVKISGTTITYDNSTYLTGNQNISLSGDVSGTGSTAITATLANSGVTAGTYQNGTTINTLTIDAKGRITSTGTPVTIAPLFSSIASKPTTISGYGITDGATLTGTQTFTNKTLTDNTTFFQDNLDNTKKAQFQLSSIATGTTRTFTLPNVNGTLITSGDTGTVTNTMLAGSIADTKLNTIETAGKVSNSATTATNANTASAIVARDANGNFSVNAITANSFTGQLTGTASNSSQLNNISLNGSGNLGVPFNSIPRIKSDGVIELGRYLDFHAISNDTKDYNVRLDTGADGTAKAFTLPNNGGKLLGSNDPLLLNLATSAPQSLASFVTALAFNTVSRVDSLYTMLYSNTQIRINQAGYYRISANFAYSHTDANAVRFEFAIRYTRSGFTTVVNGGNISGVCLGGTGFNGLGSSACVCYLNAQVNDVITVAGYIAAGVATTAVCNSNSVLIIEKQ